MVRDKQPAAEANGTVAAGLRRGITPQDCVLQIKGGWQRGLGLLFGLALGCGGGSVPFCITSLPLSI